MSKAKVQWFRPALVMVLALGVVARPDAGIAAEAVDAQLKSLEAGVQAAESIRAVKKLQHAFAHYQEAGLWADMADLFSRDAVGQFAGREVKGRAALLGFFMEAAGRKRAGLDAGQLNVNLPNQPVVTLGADGVTARGTWHNLAARARFGVSASWVGDVYENEYALEDGKWKISRMQVIPQYAGAFEDYGHKAPAAWNIPYHFKGSTVGVSIPGAAVDALAARAAAAPAGKRATDLQQRLGRLRDETQVQNLQHALGYYLDRKMYDDVSELFASDGTMELAQRGVYAGPARIRKALEVIHGPTPLVRGELFDHILLGTVVSIAADGQHAAARSIQLGQLGLVGKGAQWELGIFENRFVKEDGKWKIASVRFFQRARTDYDKGWAVDAMPVPTVEASLAPDRPPSQRYAAFPKAQSVGLSFANPVTGKPARAPEGPVVRIPLVSDRPAATRAVTTVDAALVADLQRQLRVVVGVDATENLMSSYGWYIDESDWNSMADTYASTGFKEFTGVGTYVGPDRIRKALIMRGPASGRNATTYTIHQVVQPVINVAEDGMSAKARLRLFQDGGAADGTSGSWIGGIYENTAVFENGQWKFGVQDLTHTFNASYRNGWARVGGATGGGAAPAPAAAPAPPAAPVAPPANARDVRGGGLTEGLGGMSRSNWSKDFPPDGKIRARQYAFPEIVEPAFHYANPVSGRPPKEWVNQ